MLFLFILVKEHTNAFLSSFSQSKLLINAYSVSPEIGPNQKIRPSIIFEDDCHKSRIPKIRIRNSLLLQL